MQKFERKSADPKAVPSVILDAENGKFKISGRSLPEDVLAFFNPVLEWLDQYIQEANASTVFEFKLTYYNTASSKLLYEIMKKLETIAEDGNKEVLIKWYYDEDDEDMEEAGEEYEEVVSGVKFEHIEIPNEDD